MTRLDKLTALRQRSPVDARIDIFTCNEEEINRIFSISENLQKSITKSFADWHFLNQLVEKQGRGAAIGKFK
jgi:hypothetical protein